MAIQKGWRVGFSNESGLGSAPIAAAAAKTTEPVEQGLISMTGTFIDTIIICSLTVTSLLVSDEMQQGTSTLTQDMFTGVFGPVGGNYSIAMLGALCDHDHSWMVLLRRAVFRIPLALLSTSIGPSCLYG